MYDPRTAPTDRITRGATITPDLCVDDLEDTAKPRVRLPRTTMTFSGAAGVKLHARIRSWLRGRGVSV